MIRIFVNNILFLIKKDISILEALSYLGLKIPRFCYHEALSIAGNCRICLVEIYTSIKLVASCAQPILPNMQIFSNTIKVLKTRENVLESLLLNHPLDCPICDQAGECDLQDQSKTFGTILTRFIFNKRVVENKIIDPCIKTIMTRCIHCTRCIRYATELTGKTFLGTLNRGKNTEIGGYISLLHDSSEISGNVIDLCPVGALTAKAYAYKARPWELRTIETLDFTDGIGSNIYANVKELELINILPKNNININGQWLSNKARFFFDSLQRYRLSDSYIKNTLTKLEKTNTSILINSLENKIEKKIFLINAEIDLGSATLLKRLCTTNFSKVALYNTDTHYTYTNYYSNFNNKNNLSTLEQINSNCFVLLATNLRLEAAILNIKLRIKAKNKRIFAVSLGLCDSSLFTIKFINLCLKDTLQILEAKHKTLSSSIFTKQKPIFLIGEAFLKRCFNTKNSLTSFINKFYSNNIILFINKKVNSEIKYFHNIKAINSRIIQLSSIFNWCALEDNLKIRSLFIKTKFQHFNIWLHTHGSILAKRCSYVLPLLSYFEMEAVFINLEKRPQKGNKVIENGSTSAVSLYYFISTMFSQNSLERTINKFSPYYYIIEMVKNPSLFNNISIKFFNNDNYLVKKSRNINYPFKIEIYDYYLTNSYTRYSLNMTNYSSKRQLAYTVLSNLSE